MMTEQEKAVAVILDAVKSGNVNINQEFSHEYEAGWYTMSEDCIGTKRWSNILQDEAEFVVGLKLERWNDEGVYKDILNVNIDKCPICGEVRVLDALSKEDNTTPICSTCYSEQI
jgi:hypothetical protein